jgi:hypothetical protein
MYRNLALATLLCLLVIPAQAQQCSDGLVYDDGDFEANIFFLPSEFRGEVAMLFEPSSLPAKLTEICICWDRRGANHAIDFDIRVWATNGPGGAPGTLIGEIPGLTAVSVPSDPDGRFYTYDVSSANLILTEPVYIGPSWFFDDGPDIALCLDTTATTPFQPAYVGQVTGANDSPDEPLGPGGFFSGYRAVGLRAKLEESTGTCTPTATALCLLEDRFRVEVAWETNQGGSGQGQAVELTPDTGYFWFFTEENVEMVVKVRDACVDPFNRFWVFAGGLTNVMVTMTVTDTLTNEAQTYTNPLGTPFKPITDTNAFATCP